jgi:hypothetical protein
LYVSADGLRAAFSSGFPAIVWESIMAGCNQLP